MNEQAKHPAGITAGGHGIGSAWGGSSRRDILLLAAKGGGASRTTHNLVVQVGPGITF